MKGINQKIKDYLEKNNITIETFATQVDIDVERINAILSDDADITRQEKKKINKLIVGEVSTAKRISKILDLIFRFGASIMAIVTLLLCINGNVQVETLIVLLSIGLVCSSMIMLPKIDK